MQYTRYVDGTKSSFFDNNADLRAPQGPKAKAKLVSRQEVIFFHQCDSENFVVLWGLGGQGLA
jgi:hypothetical protein